MLIKRKSKYYYISYIVGITNNMKYGSGTFEETGLPDLERYIKEINCLEDNKGKNFTVLILSCIEVQKDFIND